jgi:hypothetical protein
MTMAQEATTNIPTAKTPSTSTNTEYSDPANNVTERGTTQGADGKAPKAPKG